MSSCQSSLALYKMKFSSSGKEKGWRSPGRLNGISSGCAELCQQQFTRQCSLGVRPRHVIGRLQGLYAELGFHHVFAVPDLRAIGLHKVTIVSPPAMKGAHLCSYTYYREIRRSQTWILASLTRVSIYGLVRRTRQPMKPTYAGSVITSFAPPWAFCTTIRRGPVHWFIQH